MSTVMISAGDASGDLHAAALVAAMRGRRPDLEVVGLGGDALRKQGMRGVVDQSELAIGGLFELATSLPRAIGAYRRMADAVVRERPDLLVLVDSGGFNIPLAGRVRRKLNVPILYFVPPQVWAWRPGRLGRFAARVDRIALILPFEPDHYARAGVPADYVGHPLVDDFAELRERLGRGEARHRLGLEADRRCVALFPGSRRNEIKEHLPIQLAAARTIAARHPVEFVLGRASSVDPQWIEGFVRASPVPVRVLDGRTPEILRAADVALLKPGTVTVEAMLSDCPMVVMGRAHPLTAAIVRRRLQVPWLAMPNLIAGEPIVPELLQEQATPDGVAAAVGRLLDPPAADAQRVALRRAAARLGDGGAIERVAGIAEALLERAQA